ncbi:hypothetical protein JL722_11340 [Aureococcus anophagefferens]|nr:hypothetical protein JL722_11340 [Aureococcus anophagefferens]
MRSVLKPLLALLATTYANDLFSLLSACENVTIESVESRGFSCLSVDSGAVAAGDDAAATPVCEDTKAWTDGSNGCAAYARAEADGEKWCERFGARGAGADSAAEHCCACGGGTLKPYRFGVGDAIRFREHVDGTARATCTGTGAWSTASSWPCGPRPTTRTRRASTVASRSSSSPRRRTPRRRRRRDGLLLLPCDATDASERAERLWRPSAFESAEGETLVILEHAVSGARISADFGDEKFAKKQSLKFPGEVRAPDEPPAFGGDVLRLRNAFDAGVSAWADVVNIGRRPSTRRHARPHCLTSAAFGKPSYDKPEWTECGEEPGAADASKGLPATMWRLACADDDARYEGDAARAHLARAASAKDCKAAFREMGRVLHPDKRGALASKIDDPEALARADDLFRAAQDAYDGLKNSDEQARERFRLDEETDDGLFGSSRDVFELTTPGDITVEDDGAVRLAVTDTTTLWVIFLYNPGCMMSRTVAPLVELGARAVKAGPHPADVDVKFGAFACGHHAEAGGSFQRKGYAAVFEDAVCKSSFGRVTIEATLDNIPARLAAFARQSARLVASAATLERAEDAEAFAEFQTTNLNITRAILFVDGASPHASAVEMALASRARSLRHAGAAVLVAECGADENCDAQETPQIKIYGPESLGGRSLVDEPLADLRDAQVAVSAAAAFATAVSKTDGSLTDDTETFTPEEDLPRSSPAAAAAARRRRTRRASSARGPRNIGAPPTAAPRDVEPPKLEPPKLSKRNAGQDTWANAGAKNTGARGLYGGKPMGGIGMGGTARIRNCAIHERAVELAVVAAVAPGDVDLEVARRGALVLVADREVERALELVALEVAEGRVDEVADGRVVPGVGRVRVELRDLVHEPAALVALAEEQEALAPEDHDLGVPRHAQVVHGPQAPREEVRAAAMVVAVVQQVLRVRVEAPPVVRVRADAVLQEHDVVAPDLAELAVRLGRGAQRGGEADEREQPRDERPRPAPRRARVEARGERRAASGAIASDGR